MALNKQQHQEIKEYLIQKIRQKLETYNSETNSMPFHYRLLGKDRMALFSFVHSVNTMLGQSIFEHVGKIIAEKDGVEAIAQYRDFSGYISSEAVLKIDNIMRELRTATRKPDKEKEIKEIIKVAQKGNLGKEIKKRIDLFVKTDEKTEYFFEIKTAKPNIDVFKSVKKQLLEWVAMRASHKNSVAIKTIVAIPYNPYEPEPYERWTLQGLFDLKHEVLVGKEFWDLLGGKNTYEDLLDVFKEAGLELYDEIDEKMKGLNNK
ncbi:MAG: TdeIII family type II restriction endonuclease [Candidatus Lokiarchaeota archaeon]|nr:TdeIII family type II restriction endonuclease [Candidatus Lokiarchaeota archaeon]